MGRGEECFVSELLLSDHEKIRMNAPEEFIIQNYESFKTNNCSRARCYLGDGADCLGASLSEHQSLVAVQVLWSLDEAEVD